MKSEGFVSEEGTLFGVIYLLVDAKFLLSGLLGIKYVFCQSLFQRALLSLPILNFFRQAFEVASFLFGITFSLIFKSPFEIALTQTL